MFVNPWPVFTVAVTIATLIDKDFIMSRGSENITFFSTY